MTKQEKGIIIDQLVEKFSNTDFFYMADSSSIPVEEINAIRRLCFEKGIEFTVTKNTLIKKALERVEGKTYSDELLDLLKGPTTLMFSEASNAPAKMLKEYRGKDKERPILKAAYIDSEVFVGDDNLEVLSNLKSKNELIADVVFLLQSPATNLVSALNSGGSTLAGLLKTLEEREG